MIYIIIFIFGLLIGSFLNAVIYRLHSGESIIKKRSHCPKCGHILAWHELIPVVSFVVQKRRCRACGEKISWQYPGVEIVTGLLFLLIFNFQFSNFQSIFESSNFQLPTFLYLVIISSLLIVIFVYDLKHYLIPDKIIYPAIGLVFVYRVFEFLRFENWSLIENWNLKIENLEIILIPLVSAIIASAFFAAIFFVSRGRAMGFGDVKLAFFMGLFLGWPNILVALFLAFVLGGIIGVGLILSGKKTMHSQVPFGPFLIAGTFSAFLWGKEIISWYMNLLI